MPVVYYNPCFKEDFFKVTPLDSLNEVECVAGEECVWTHEDFDVFFQNESILEICAFTYTVTADVSLEFYDSVTHEVSINVNDMTLIGHSITFTVSISLDFYPDSCDFCAWCCVYSTGVV